MVEFDILAIAFLAGFVTCLVIVILLPLLRNLKIHSRFEPSTWHELSKLCATIAGFLFVSWGILVGAVTSGISNIWQVQGLADNALEKCNSISLDNQTYCQAFQVYKEYIDGMPLVSIAQNAAFSFYFAWIFVFMAILFWAFGAYGSKKV